MILETLTIRRLPGIDTPFETPRLSPGFNIVVGPNGIGKTSLRRAVAALVWPETVPSALVDVAAVWREGRHRLEAQRLGKAVVWLRDGKPIDPPELPPRAHAHCFTIASEDLVEDNLDDAALVEWIQQQMAGGYDLNAVLNSAPFELGARHGQNARRDWQKQQTELERAVAQQRQLEARYAELPNLEARRDRALAAREEVTRLERTLERLEWQRLRNNLDREFRTFPKELAALHGDELKRGREEFARLGERQQQLREIDRELERLVSLEPSGPLPTLHEIQLSKSWLEKLERSALRTRELDRQLVKVEAQIARLRGRDAAARSGSESRFDPERSSRAASPPWDTIETLLRRGSEFDLREQQLTSARSEIPDRTPIDNAGLEMLASSIRSLEAWLQAGPTITAPLAVAGMTGWLLAGVGIAFGWDADTPFELTVFLSVPLAFGLGALALRSRWRSSRSEQRQRFRETQLDEPAAWLTDPVRTRLAELRRDHQLAQRAEQHAADRERLQSSALKLNDERQAWNEELARVSSEYDLPADCANLELWAFVREWTRLEELREEVATLAAEQTLEDTSAAESRSELENLLPPTTPSTQPTPSNLELRVRLEVATESVRERQAAESRRELLVERREELQQEIDAGESRIHAIFIRAGIEFTAKDRENHERELAHRVEGLPRYRALKDEIAGLEARIGESSSKESTVELSSSSEDDRNDSRPTESTDPLPPRSSVESSVADTGADKDTVQRQLATARFTADQYGDWIAKISELETDRARTTQEGRVSELLAQLDESRTRLDQQREQALFAAAGRWQLVQASELHRQKSQPRVFKRAHAMFGLFTQYKLELILNDAGIGRGPVWFQARDTERGMVRELGQLSSGARTQLLLAVRLAFALEADPRHELPLFLDEVLSHSDPDRRRALAGNLIQLVKVEERQIIAITCQPSDARQLEELLQEAKTDFLSIDMAALRGAPASEAWGEADLELPPTGPDPEQLRVLESAAPSTIRNELRVPSLDLAAGLDRQHVYYLAPDAPTTVFPVLALGLDTIGPIRSLLARSDSTALLEDDSRSALLERLALADVFHDLWSRGRSEPLDPRRLEQLGFSDRYYRSACQIAEEVDWDAGRFARSLEDRSDARLKGLRNRERLILMLKEQGWVDSRTPYRRDELVAEALLRFAGRVEDGEVSGEGVAEAMHRWWDLANPKAVSPKTGAKKTGAPKDSPSPTEPGSSGSTDPSSTSPEEVTSE